MKPNIVIFNPDHYRGEAMGHMGNPCVHTPTLDRMVAEDSVSFSQAFCQNPVCTPSRCSFMSGWYPHVRGHRTMSHMMRPDEPVLLRTLKENGYYVWWGGKNDLVPGQDGYDPFCHVRYETSKPTRGRGEGRNWRGEPGSEGYHSFFLGRLEKKEDEDVYFDKDWSYVLGAVEMIRNRPKDMPFCIYLPLSYPHPPFSVEEPFFSMIDRSLVPPRIPTPESWEGKPSMAAGIHERTGMQNWTEDQWTEMRAVYYGMCSRVDHQLGRVVEALQEAGLYDDTAIFFFSDHGMWTGDYGLVDINQNTFEDALARVPLVVKPPKSVPVQPGTRDTLVELVDFPATAMEMTGIEPKHYDFGKSLLPLIAGETEEHRDAVFCEGGRAQDERHCAELEYEPGHKDPNDLYYPRLSLQASDGPEHTKAVMCRTKTHKYVYRLYEQDELYDLVADPSELVNRIDDPSMSVIKDELKNRLLRFMVETADAVPLAPDSRA